MDFAGVPSPHMNWDSSNLPDAWRKFRQHAELMFAGPLKKMGEEQKCSYLLLWIGEKGRDIFNTWTLTTEAAKVLKTYYDKYEAYVMPKTNTIFARYRFHERIQGANESFEQFVTELRLLVKDCAYANSEEMVRDRVVFGIHSPRVREKLLSVGSELTLDKAIDIARSHEIAQTQLKTFENSAHNPRDQAVYAVSTQKELQKRTAKAGMKALHRSNNDVMERARNCGYCGNHTHGPSEKCPAKGKQCAKCGKRNHFAKVCRSAFKRNVHVVSKEALHDEEAPHTEFFVDAVLQKSCDTEQAFADILLGKEKTEVSFKLDTGAQVNVIPMHTFNRLRDQCKLTPTKHSLTGYGGQMLTVKGTCALPCRYKDRETVMDFYIVNTPAPPILGLKACLDLDLIKLVLSVNALKEDKPIMEEYADVFDGIGLFPGECTIHLKPDATPVVYPPRRIPLALRGRLKEELQNMEKQGVIVKVTEPTDWVNALVVVEKQSTGRLRVCLDPRDLNKAIKRPHYPLPTLEDITPKLMGAKYFSVLDARSGYWAIKLSEESSKLTTFNTVFGRYRFQRLPFGIISAQDEFQRKIDETYEGLNGVVAIVDDILIYGQSKEEHDSNLHAMLQRSREKGVKLNPEKSIVCASEVRYFGHCLSAEGVKPDPEKVSAIKHMEPPKSKAELETVLGMVNYLSKFAPCLADINAPLRQLLKQSSEFIWDSQHDTAFNKMKDLITKEPGPVLAYYDPQKELHLQVDASKYGLGAVLLQDGKPLSYASRSLTESEVNYAQIEKELYAVLFGCKRFHQYVYGRKVIVESDHKPLEAVMKKPLAAAPPRLQRMILQLQKYDINITHRPGKEIPVADTLSRKFIETEHDNLSEGMDMQVHMVYESLPVSDTKLQQIRAATESDSQLVLLRRVILDGWPGERKNCPAEISDFWNFRDELSLINGIILKGEKVVIPSSLREEMLTRIHVGHMGIEKSKQRARDVLFWPGMSKQIERMVEKCDTCLERRCSNTKEPMIPHKIPTRPWQVIASDLFAWNNEEYMVTVDYYSRFFELDKLNTSTTATVISKLKVIFARHGIPEKVVSDNGPQYRSKEFEDFAKTWGFTHTTTSPYYPQSNGLAEKTVQIAKSILSKAKTDRKDPYLSLLEYRNTPVDNFKSPAQLLMSRRLRSILPTTNEQLLPETVSFTEAHSKRVKQQQHQKKYYDRSTRPLSQLHTGQPVRIQEHGLWKPAVVVHPANTQRSYHVCTSDGQVYRRNRRHLLSTKEKSAGNTCVSANIEEERNSIGPATLQVHTEVPAEHSKDTQPIQHHTRSGRAVRPRVILDL